MPYRLRLSVDGGYGGGDLNARFIRRAGRALQSRGRIYNPLVAWSSPALSVRAIRDAGYQAYEIARANIPVWGRGNNTRQWLLDRPGRHLFRYRYRKFGDTTARILELRKDGAPPASSRKPLPVEIEFRAGRP